MVSRADADYPRHIKSRLREESPPVICGCGDKTLLDTGRLAAQAGKILISSSAKGIDQITMHSAFSVGGRFPDVLADSLEKKAAGREYRKLLRDAQLGPISPYAPNATFNASLATRRNKLIYAPADAALVLSASFRKGSTWAGRWSSWTNSGWCRCTQGLRGKRLPGWRRCAPEARHRGRIPKTLRPLKVGSI